MPVRLAAPPAAIQVVACLAEEGGRGMMGDWDPDWVQHCLDEGWVEQCCHPHLGDFRLTWAGWEAVGFKGM